MPVQVSFFFRKAYKGQFSIEKTFNIILDNLSEEIDGTKHWAPCRSKGILRRIWIGIDAFFNRNQVNHITGDIHFIATFLPGEKTILTIHDIESSLASDSFFRNRIIEYFWYQLPFKRVSIVTVISEATASSLKSRFQIPDEKIRIIPNPVPMGYSISPKIFDEGLPIILQIGTKKNKNLPNLYNALEGIKCKLIVVGRLESNDLMQLQDKKIDFENYYNCTDAEIKALYERSDIVSLISLYEGFGLPIIEAQAVGRVVITSNCSSMPEVSGEGALLVDPLSVDSIRKGFIRLFRDENLRNELIAKGQQNILRFTPQKIAAQYTALYKQIAES